MTMPFPQEPLCPVVMVQIAGQWLDMSTRVRGPVVTAFGGRDEATTILPGSCHFDLDNGDGHLSPDNPLSPHFPHVDIAMPVRIRLPPGMVPEADEDRFQGEVSTWQPYWVQGVEDEARIRVEAHGILLRLLNDSEPLLSPLHRAILPAGPVVYWTMEDGTEATQLASALPGGQPMRVSGLSLASAGTVPGAALLPSGNGTLSGPLDLPAAATGWLLGILLRMDSAPAQPHQIRVTCSGGQYEVLQLAVNQTGVALTGLIDDTPTSLATVTRDIGNRPVWIELSVRQVGTAVYRRVTVDFADVTDQISFSQTIERPTRIQATIVAPNVEGNPPTVVGHWALCPRAQTVRGAVEPAAGGFVGEEAWERVRRLGAEEAVPMEMLGAESRLRDEFDRTEAGDWGTAPTGQTWQHDQFGPSPDIVFDVTPGSATMAAQPGHSGSALAYIDVDADRVEWLTQFTLGSDPGLFGAIVFSGDVADLGAGSETFISWSLFTQPDTSNVQVAAIADGELLGSLWGMRQDGWPADQPVWVRFQAVGDQVRLRAWLDSQQEPAGWDVVGTIPGSTRIRGAVGYLVSLLEDTTTEVHHVHVTQVPVSQRMGVQRQTTFVGCLRDAAATDLGLLSEARVVSGIAYRPLADLYNQNPSLVLSARSPDGQSQGQIGASYAPKLDTSQTRNDIVVGTPAGDQVRVTQETGPRSVHPPPDGVGRWPDSAVAHPAGPQQLANIGGWLLHLSTDASLRLPVLPLDLAWSPEVIPGWASLRLGDRLDLADLPRQGNPDLRVLLTGWTEALSATEYQVRGNAVPADPYTVGMAAAGHFIGAESPTFGMTGVEPQDAQAGDLLIAMIRNDNSAPGGPAGWTQVGTTIGPVGTFNEFVNVWRIDRGEGPPDLTWTGTPGAAWVVVLGYRDVTPVPVDAAQSAAGSAVAPSVTATANGQRLLCLANVELATPITGVPAGMRRLLELEPTMFLAADQPVDAGATGTRTFDVDSPVGAWSILLELLPSAAPDAPSRYSPGTDADPGIRVSVPFEAGADTELEIATTVGPRWTTDPDDFPVDLRLFGSRTRATGAGPAVEDTFTRTVVDGWGSPDVGPGPWTVLLGDPAEVSVAGGVGSLAPQGVAAPPHVAVAAQWSTIEAVCRLRATGGIFGLLARVDTASQDGYVCMYDEDGDVSIYRLDGGTPTMIAGFADGPLFVALDWYRMRVHVVGDQIQMRVWPDGDPEPAAWTLEATDSAYAAGGVGAVAAAGVGPETAEFDDLQVVHPQRMTVQQEPINGVHKTVPAGSPVELWTPARYAL